MRDSPSPTYVREYLMESANVCLLLLAVCIHASVLEYPGSPVHQSIPDPLLRRLLRGLAIGATVVALIYSPWGRRTGAHLNPATTLTFFRLGKVAPREAAFLMLAQFAGAVAGVGIAALVLHTAVSSPEVNFAVTRPGSVGIGWAFAAEALLAFVLMSAVLLTMNTKALHALTGVLAGSLLAAFITLAGPISGMSINPARSFGPALIAELWTALWIYFVAPPVGMLLAAEVYRRIPGRRVYCAKMYHDHASCIFRCGYGNPPPLRRRRPTMDR